MIENEEGFLRESRRDWEKLGGGASCARRGNGGSGGGSGRSGSDGSGGGSGIAPDSLTRQLPITPKGTSWKMETEDGRVENKK